MAILCDPTEREAEGQTKVDSQLAALRAGTGSAPTPLRTHLATLWQSWMETWLSSAQRQTPPFTRRTTERKTNLIKVTQQLFHTDVNNSQERDSFLLKLNL